MKKCKQKSLLRRIRLMVSVAAFSSILVMAILLVVGFWFLMDIAGMAVSEHYADEIETAIYGVCDGTAPENNPNSRDEMAEAIGVLHHKLPFVTIDVVIGDELVYSKGGKVLARDAFIFSEHVPREDMEKVDEAIGEMGIGSSVVFRELYPEVEGADGFLYVGIDQRMLNDMYGMLLVVVVPLCLVVLLVMNILTKALTKPILKPLSTLTDQLNRLAEEDDAYETIAPSLEVNERSVKEVYDLTVATNRVLEKMLNYSEAITQSEKMASVGQLTAAITHEINTPLGAINANVGMIKMLAEAMASSDACGENEEAIMMRNQIEEAASLSEESCQRIDKIVRSLKVYSRIDQADFMPADINESVDSVVILTTNLHKNRIQVHKAYEKLPMVNCHIGLVNQVFMNIFVNAVQAIEGQGEVTIKTWADETDVHVSITDDGCGISAQNLLSIFDYGFTTKQPGSGSGIGLALSSNIVKKHNGKILVDSEEGKGATFEVVLPIQPIGGGDPWQQ